MKIAVAGSGALGGFFGYIFASTDQDVTLVDIDSEKVKAIREPGLTVTSRQKEETIHIEA
jgi:ketopantoate reductase